MVMWHVQAKRMCNTTRPWISLVFSRMWKNRKSHCDEQERQLSINLSARRLRQCRIKGIPKQSLRDGQQGAEFQLKVDGTNHPEPRRPKEAEEISQVLSSIHIQYLCQEHRKEQIYYTSCHMFALAPRCQGAKSRKLEIIGRELGQKP